MKDELLRAGIGSLSLLLRDVVMFRLFLLVFAIVPFLELLILLKVAETTSWLTTAALVVSTGMVGISIVRWQGVSTWKQIHQQLAAGRSPARPIVSGVLILIAGAMLLTPGLLTDTTGFLLLVPPIRNSLAAWLQKRFTGGLSTRFQSAVWVSAPSEIHPDGFQSQRGGAEQSPASSSERPRVVVVEPGSDRQLPRQTE